MDNVKEQIENEMGLLCVDDTIKELTDGKGNDDEQQ